MRNWNFLICMFLISIHLSAQVYIPDTFTKLKNNSEFAEYPFAGGLNNPQFYEIDFNFDGIKDLYIFDRTGGKSLTFLNNGTPGQVDYVYAPVYESIFPKMENFVVLTDVNCDGIEDIFTSYDNGIKVFYSQVSGTSFSYVEFADKLEYAAGGFNFEIFVGVIDIPAIVDVNLDGDPDILNFRPAGGYVDYFENKQMENGDPCGTFSLELITSCWGNFYESGISKSVDLDIACKGVAGGRAGMHAGSTFLAFDYDVDADIDILLGDLSFNNLNLLTNGGDASFAHIISQDTVFPSYDVEANIATFPASFLVDVNNDGKKDLLAAPNKRGFSENF
ncbi:MAG: FG-GAP repeat domain-containing protein, partial [Chitinophagales bacterium]